MLRRSVTISLIMTATMLLLIVACGRKKPEDTGSDNKTAKPRYASKGDEGTITGKISFDGTPAAQRKIDMSQDAKCASAPGEKTVDDEVVTDGKLANVFVYLKGGPVDKFTFPTPSDPVVLDQQGCKYHPRVLGIQTNQTLKVVNSDSTTHNVHPSPKLNDEWNQMQAQGAPPIEKKFGRPETLIPVKCNQHPWMKASIGVLGHPCFAISATDGSYTIKNVPPGAYTIVFWHEKLGEQTQQVTVAAKESKTQDITFKGGAAAGAPSMQIGPTLVLP